MPSSLPRLWRGGGGGGQPADPPVGETPLIGLVGSVKSTPVATCPAFLGPDRAGRGGGGSGGGGGAG